MSLQDKIDALQKQPNALKAELAKPEEIPDVWFVPEKDEEYYCPRMNGNGQWYWDTFIAGIYIPDQPVLHPYHAERWCEAQNMLAKLREESDEVVHGKWQFIVAQNGCFDNYEGKKAKYAYGFGIIKNSEQALLDLLSKHNTTPEAVAKMMRFVNGDKTAGDW